MPDPAPRLNPRTAGRLGSWLLLGLLPAAAGFARLSAHPAFFFDGEASIPATIGRELHLHGLSLAFHYQVVPYQGSLIVDSGLSALGYAVFGDHLMAWHWVPLLYLTIAAFAGMDLLHRAVGAAAAGSWPLLLAAAPFFIKDGWVVGIGGHAAAAAWGLLAAALSTRTRPDPGGWRWAFAGGALLAFGAWHVRSAAFATPAVLLAASLGGRRAVLAALAGLSLFGFLVAANLALLLGTGTFWEGTALSDLAERMLSPAANREPRPLAARLGLVTGWTTGPAGFLQPPTPSGEVIMRPGWLLSGRSWPATWLLSVPAGLVAWRLGPRTPARDRLLLVAAALPAAWILGSAMSPYGVDDAVVSAMTNLRKEVPAAFLGGTSYAIPLYSMWLFVCAAAIGLCWAAPRLRPLAAGLLLVPVAVGSFHAVGDQRTDRDGTPLGELHPFFYPGISLPGRMPPAKIHLRCMGVDPDSTAFHRAALAPSLHRGIDEIAKDPGVQARALTEAAAAAGLDDEAAGALARAVGSLLGEAAAADDGGRLARFAEAALGTAAGLTYPMDMEYLTGFVRPLDPSIVGDDPARWIDRLCDLEGVAIRPAGTCR